MAMKLKSMCLMLLAMISSASFAQEGSDEIRQEILSAFSQALVVGVCSAKEQSAEAAALTQDKAEFSVQAKELHGCQYISETLASGCSRTHSCISYRQWSAQNPGLSPSLPREAFLHQLKLRQDAMGMQTALNSEEGRKVDVK